MSGTASRLSLRQRLLAGMLLTALVSVTAALSAMIALDLQAYHQTAIADSSTQAELLGRTSAAALAFKDPEAAQENLAVLQARPEVLAAGIYTPHGELFASYSTPGQTLPITAPATAKNEIVEGGMLTLTIPIHDNGEWLGSIYLRSRYELKDRITRYVHITLLVTLGTMVVALLVSTWLQRLVISPLVEVVGTARRVVADKSYSFRARKVSQDEVGELVDAFNDMLDEIELRNLALERSNQDKAQEVEERKVAQQEVMRLNQDLEQRVLSRTAQLERSNKDLQRATASAEHANRAKSEFLSSMSHELRTPLNAILGFGQLLEMEPAATERRRAYTEHILKAGKHLLTLIDEILNLAQIESGQVKLQMETIQLADVISECRDMVEPMAQASGLALHFPQETQLGVRADRTRLKQVLLNLMSNAIKYNRPRGSVTVRIERLPASDHKQRMRLSVQDTGIGLSSTQLNELFQPFNRLGQEGGAVEGTGIGLVVTQRLVVLMDGEMGVESELGQGSLFWIELQSSQSHEAFQTPAASLPAPPQQPHGKQHTLLYIEDNPASLELVAGALRHCPDLQLITASDGRRGVEMAMTHHPDLILLDLNLPHMHGSQVLQLLKNNASTVNTPTIALTANADEMTRAACLALGFSRYLTKPLDVHTLLSAIYEALPKPAALTSANKGPQAL
jgi:signal transduction histidine kinase/ActR/RegA family two-component response regulator